MLVFENPYCTVDQVREELRNKDQSLTEAIEDSIIQVSRYIDDHKGRDYFQHDHSVNPLLLDRFDTALIIQDTVFLPYTPIITLTSVTVAGELWVVDTDYIVKSNGVDARLISMRGSWPLGLATDKISILGKFGYEQTGINQVPTKIPAHINKAAVLGAAALSGHNLKSVVGIDGQASSVVDKNLPKAFWDLLGKRRTFL